MSKNIFVVIIETYCDGDKDFEMGVLLLIERMQLKK